MFTQYQMVSLFHRGLSNFLFDSNTFRNSFIFLALSCLTHSSKDTLTEAAMKATEILNSMRENYESGNSRMSPNAHCYNVVMDVWARQGNPEKAEEIFMQMCNDVRRGNLAAKPQTATYNSTF